MTVRGAIQQASTQIAQRDAERLLGYVLHRERASLLAHPEARVEAAHDDNFRALVARRAAGEPLQYIIGEQEFFGLTLRVTPAVLIPRPETEHLVEAVLEWAALQPGSFLRVADVGTGSGAIALALVSQLANAHIVGTDTSTKALAIAQENAKQLGLEDRVRFLLTDLLGAAAEADGSLRDLDAVVSNPPYVPNGDAATMQREVVEHEPHAALFAGDDGLDIYRRLIPQARVALRMGGLLAMEIGYGQRDAIGELLDGWRNTRFLPDYAGVTRVVLAERA